MMSGYEFGMFGGGIFSSIAMFIFMGLIIWFIISLISKSTGVKSSESEAMKILKSRYTKGELTKKQYQEMKKNIK